MKKLFYNAKVYMRENHFVDAFITEGDRFFWVGQLKDLKDKPEIRINLEGKLVLPGFNDSHLHLYNLGKERLSCHLRGAISVEDMLKKACDFLGDHPMKKGEFFVARGWNQDLFDNQIMPSKEDLDRLNPDLNILFVRNCGHIAVANSSALKEAGIDKNFPDPSGGKILRNEDGEPTGILHEKAIDLIYDLVPRSSKELIKSNYLEAMNYALSQGVTSVQSNDIQSSHATLLAEVLEEIAEAPLLRYRHQITLDNLSSLLSFKKAFVETPDYLEFGPLKLYKDGSLGARTAHLSEDYKDDPGNRGLSVLSSNELDKIMIEAEKHKIQVILHAIGDQAVLEVLDSFEKNMAPKNPNRHGIVHNQITSKELLKRAADLKVTVFYQPIFLDEDIAIVEKRVGNNLASTSYAFKTFKDLGGIMGFSTDAPIEDINPFHNIYCAMTRKPLKERTDSSYLPWEALSLSECIDAYTMGSAYLAFKENSLGRIEKNYFADFIILDDLFSMTPEVIRDTSVLETFVGGEQKYIKNPSF